MDHAAHARALLDREHLVACIDHALLAARELGPSPDALELRVLVGRALEKLRQHPPALRCLDDVVASAPDHAHALAHRGSVLDRMLQRERARADLGRALELDPDYRHAWENLFYLSFDTGAHDVCDTAIANLERLGGARGYLYRLRGKRRLDGGDRAGAEADLRRACVVPEADPVAGQLLAEAGLAFENGDEHFMGAVQLQDHDPSRSLELMARALELGLSTPRRHLRLVQRYGGMLVRFGRRDDALAVARDLTDRHPDRADTWLTRADLDQDPASFARAYELSPTEAALPYARHLAATGDPDRALELCARQAAADPLDPAARVLLGELHLAAGRRDEARAAWAEAEALGSEPARELRASTFGAERGLDHFQDALTLLDRGLRADAIAGLDAAAERFRAEVRVPGDQAHRYLAKALYNAAFLRELKVPDEVIEPPLREAVEVDPSYADAMCALGNLCLRTDRVDEGLAWHRKAGAADPAAGQPWFYRARHFAQRGEHASVLDDATRAFEAYRAKGQGRFAADAIMMRGEANEALGRLHDARRDYDLAYDFGHPIGYARGDHIRTRIASEDPTSDEAGEVLDKVIERIEAGECPWGQIELLEARTQGSDKARALVDKLKASEPLEDEEIDWLVQFLESS